MHLQKIDILCTRKTHFQVFSDLQVCGCRGITSPEEAHADLFCASGPTIESPSTKATEHRQMQLAVSYGEPPTGSWSHFYVICHGLKKTTLRPYGDRTWIGVGELQRIRLNLVESESVGFNVLAIR